MSEYFDVMEHLVVKDGEEKDFCTPQNDALETMSYQMSILGALMLQDNAKIHRVKLSADGEVYSFSGECPDEGYKKIVNAIRESKDVDLVVEYGFSTYGMNEASQNAGPFVMRSQIGELNADDRNGIFYSVWCKAMSDGGEGSLYAYGEHNGTTYNGEVGFKEVSAFPAGNWYALDELAVDQEFDTEEAAAKVRNICAGLDSLCSSDNDVDGSGEEVSYYMNNVELKSESDFNRLVSGIKAIKDLGGEVSGFGEYSDTTGIDGRVMHIDYDNPDSIKILVAEIA